MRIRSSASDRIPSHAFENTGLTVFTRWCFGPIYKQMTSVGSFADNDFQRFQKQDRFRRFKMAVPDNKHKDPAAFQSDPLKDLTIQDALIISALYAVEADTEKCQHIKELAQKHPLFVEKLDAIEARVNKFTNLMQVKQPLEAVEAAVRDLKPEQRKQAFEFAVEAMLTVNNETEKKIVKLKTLAAKLALENEFVDRKLRRVHAS
jgi:hypothetical protein